MTWLFDYYGRYQGLRGNLTGLPGWAKLMVFVAALPGIILIGLSVVAFLVSLLALLILTVPVYRVLSGLTGGRRSVPPVAVPPVQAQSGRKHVEVTIVK